MSEISLPKEIGFLGALSIGAGAVLGPGEYIMSGLVAAKIGPAAVIAFLIAGALMCLTALSFAELGPMLPFAGGSYRFVKEGIGPFGGFLGGWACWLGLISATAFYTIGAAHFISDLFIPWMSVGFLTLLIIGIFTFVNLVGVRTTTTVEILLFVTSLGIILAFAVFGGLHMHPANHNPFFVTGWDSIFYSAGLITVNFVGFDLVAATAGEIKNPGRNVPAATILSLVMMVILVGGVVWVATGVVPYSSMKGTSVPIAEAARSFAGDFGFTAVSVGGILACLTGINASIMAASRYMFTLSRDAPLPDMLSDVNEKLRTPHNAVLVTGILIATWSFLGTMEKTAGITATVYLFAFILVNISLIMLRRKKPDLKRPFKVPGYPVTPAVGALACAVLYFQLKLTMITFGAIMIVGGALLYFGLKKYGIGGRT